MQSPQTQVWYKRLHIQIFIAMAVGAFAGLIFKSEAVTYLSWIGTVYVRLLKMIIVPLVFFSLVTGVMTFAKGKELGRVGIKTFLYFIFSSLFSIFIGLFLVNIIAPGLKIENKNLPHAELKDVSNAPGLLENLLEMIPTNIFKAMAEGDMIGIIIFALLFGFAIRHLVDDKRKTMLDTMSAFNDTILKLTQWIIRLAPIGVLGLIATATGKGGIDTFKQLGWYMLTVFGGLTFHTLITLSIVLMLLARINPIKHISNMLPALLTAFSTSSSSATLPVTVNTLQSRSGVSNKISSFVLPIGATANMDGTALYECVGVLFIAQILGFDLSISQQLVVVFTALVASIGAAGIPSAGLVMIFIVLEAVNLDGPNSALIVGTMMAVDRPLDMCRTTVNVYSDSVGAAVIARSEGETLN